MIAVKVLTCGEDMELRGDGGTKICTEVKAKRIIPWLNNLAPGDRVEVQLSTEPLRLDKDPLPNLPATAGKVFISIPADYMGGNPLYATEDVGMVDWIASNAPRAFMVDDPKTVFRLVGTWYGVLRSEGLLPRNFYGVLTVYFLIRQLPLVTRKKTEPPTPAPFHDRMWERVTCPNCGNTLKFEWVPAPEIKAEEGE